MLTKRLGTLIKSIAGNKATILFDQALFSLFNFGSIFVLSKLAEVSIFSDFVVFQSTIFFLFIFCTFLLSSPILVLYAKKWREEKTYLKTLFWTNAGFNCIIATILHLFLVHQGVRIPYVYVFAIPFCMTTFDILKKYMFSAQTVKFAHAMVSSVLLNLVFFSSVFYYSNDLSLLLIIKAYLFSYAVSIGYLLVVFLFQKTIPASFFIPLPNKNAQIKAIVKHHFQYAKWIILGGIAYWGYAQGLYIYGNYLSVSDLGMGKIKTIQNLLGIVSIFIITAENYYTPLFSEYLRINPEQSIHDEVKRVYKENIFKGLGLIGAVLLFSFVFYDFLYLEKYGTGTSIILLYCFSQLLMLFLRPIIIALKALEVTRPFFISQVSAVTSMLISGYYLIPKYDYWGMALCFFAAIITYSFITIYFYIQTLHLFDFTHRKKI